MQITIKAEQAKIVFDITLRERPDDNDYWDGNWLVSNVEVRLQGFSASFPASLRCEDFSNFLNDLKRMNDAMSGFAVFETMESAIYLRGEMNKTGKISWEGEVIYPAGDGSVLTFAFDNDQSYLSGLIADTEAVVKEFPAKGCPKKV